MQDKVVEIPCIGPGRYQQNNGCFILQCFPVCLLHPLFDIAIRRIAKHGMPPHFCDKPFCSFVKYRSHLWLSSVAHGSRSKPNSASNESKRYCGVSHSSEFDENSILSIGFFSCIFLCRLFLISSGVGGPAGFEPAPARFNGLVAGLPICPNGPYLLGTITGPLRDRQVSPGASTRPLSR